MTPTCGPSAVNAGDVWTLTFDTHTVTGSGSTLAALLSDFASQVDDTDGFSADVEDLRLIVTRLAGGSFSLSVSVQASGSASISTPTSVLVTLGAPDEDSGDWTLEVHARPRESTDLDYEAEIAVIIGKPGRRISQKDSWSHIAGYSCYNDGSVRDWQRHTIQWTAGKNFARTGGFGPWMVTADEIPPNTKMTLSCRLNGQQMQHATTEQMIFRIPKIIEYVSTWTTLMPGDVLVTGTPGGVGSRRTPPIWMKPGDKVEVEIDKVGILENSIGEE